MDTCEKKMKKNPRQHYYINIIEILSVLYIIQFSIISFQTKLISNQPTKQGVVLYCTGIICVLECLHTIPYHDCMYILIIAAAAAAFTLYLRV